MGNGIMEDINAELLLGPSYKKVGLEEFQPLPEGEAQYTLEYIENLSVIKLKETEDEISIGLGDIADSTLLGNLKNFHRNKKIVFYEIDKTELASYLGRKLSGEAGEGGGEGDIEERILLDKLANDAPIINLVNSILLDAIRSGASDIHLEGFSNEALVRFRIDGVLHTMQKIEKQKFPALSSRIKIMSNLNIMERRLPQDGRISVNIGNENIDMRVSIVPISKGESIVLRLFNKKSEVLKLEQLGISQNILVNLRELYKRPHGLILVTGPTGSGKTTTLSALLGEINSEEIKIITIEDPVENVIDGIDQIQTNERIGLTFNSILRRVLRQDPDVVMVGEIRDSETAELSIRAALTGHLVLSTLHTNDAISSISRLKNMGVESFLLAGVLRGTLAQRLVRKLCPNCKEKVLASMTERRFFQRYNQDAEWVYAARGCKECNNTGFKGRIAIAELFVTDEELEDMIIRDAVISDIRNYLNKKGMKGIVQDGFDKVLTGLTTITEVERAVLV